jgi:hypothetical protein
MVKNTQPKRLSFIDHEPSVLPRKLVDFLRIHLSHSPQFRRKASNDIGLFFYDKPSGCERYQLVIAWIELFWRHCL